MKMVDDGVTRRLSPTGVTSFEADAGDSLWHARVEAILTRPPGESPGKPRSPSKLSDGGTMPSIDSPLQKKAPRTTMRRHSMEGDLCPFRLLQLGLIQELHHSPNNGGGRSPRPSHWPKREAPEAAEAAEAATPTEPPKTSSYKIGGRPRRRHSMTEGPPPDYARLYLQKCAREGAPPPFASKCPKAAPAGKVCAANITQQQQQPSQQPQQSQQIANEDAQGLKRRPYRRRSMETDCPVCPFKTASPAECGAVPPYSLEDLEPTKLAQVPRELVVPRRISLGEPGRPESPSTLSHASSISNVSSVYEKKKAAARLPQLKMPVLSEGPQGLPQGSKDSFGSPRTPRRKPHRRHSVDASPFQEFRSSWDTPGPPRELAAPPSYPTSRNGASSGSHSRQRRPRFVAPRVSPSEYGADANWSGSSRSSSAKDCGERKASGLETRVDGASKPRASPRPEGGRPRRRATVDGAPGNMSSLRRPAREQREGFSTSCGNLAEGVDHSKWDQAMERYRREKHGDESEASQPRRDSDRSPPSRAGLIVDGYLRKYLRLRERKQRNQKARPESEESNLVEAPAEEKGAAKSTRRPSIGTPSTEAESTVPSLPHEFGEAARHIYITTGPGDLDVSALTSSDRFADIDADIEQLGDDRGAIEAINERNVIRGSRRRASFAGLRGSIPDDDLGAERRGYEKRKSGEFRCDAPLGRADGTKERKGRGRRRASFDRSYDDGNDAKTFQEEEEEEESAFLRQMFAEHDAFLDNVDRRYTRRRSVM